MTKLSAAAAEKSTIEQVAALVQQLAAFCAISWQ